MAKQEKVFGCSVWRMGRMDDLCGFSSADFWLRPFGIVNWHILKCW
jgi:hypothetical protein